MQDDAENKGINVVTVDLDACKLVLLEARRPVGTNHLNSASLKCDLDHQLVTYAVLVDWYGKKINGAKAKGMIFVVDSTEFTSFRGNSFLRSLLWLVTISNAHRIRR